MHRVLIGLFAGHLGDPFVHMRVLVFKSLLKFLACLEHGVPFLPVREAVVEYLAHVVEELVVGGVLVSVHLALHGGEVHWVLDFIKVVGHTVLRRLDWISEWSDESCPKA